MNLDQNWSEMLGEHYNLRLLWVPGYKTTIGNEKSRRLN